MEKKSITPKTREEIFREKADSYNVCYSTSCPVREIMAYEDFMMSIEDEQVLREGFYKEGMAKGMAEGMPVAL